MIQYFKYENRENKWFYISVNEQVFFDKKFATILYDNKPELKIEVKEIYRIEKYWENSNKEEFTKILQSKIDFLLQVQELKNTNDEDTPNQTQLKTQIK